MQDPEERRGPDVLGWTIFIAVALLLVVVALLLFRGQLVAMTPDISNSL